MGDVNVVIFVASVLIILGLSWDNRHHRHIWRDEDRE